MISTITQQRDPKQLIGWGQRGALSGPRTQDRRPTADCLGYCSSGFAVRGSAAGHGFRQRESGFGNGGKVSATGGRVPATRGVRRQALMMLHLPSLRSLMRSKSCFQSQRWIRQLLLRQALVAPAQAVVLTRAQGRPTGLVVKTAVATRPVRRRHLVNRQYQPQQWASKELEKDL